MKTLMSLYGVKIIDFKSEDEKNMRLLEIISKKMARTQACFYLYFKVVNHVINI